VRRVVVERDDHILVLAGIDLRPGEIGHDREPSAPPVDKDGELDGPGAAVVEKLVEGRLRRPAGEEHVVDKQHRRPVYVPGKERGREFLGYRVVAYVVAVKRDIQVADALGAQLCPEPAGQRDPPVRYPEDQEVFRLPVAGLNGGCEPFYCGVNLPGADGLG